MEYNALLCRQDHLAKATSLFALRCLPECLGLAASVENERETFLKCLLNLQCSIYELDAYGEKHWNLDTPELDRIWGRIRQAWSDIPIRSDHRPSLIEIENYQQIEIDMRDGRRPDIMPIDVFYECKTCDVRLMRRLIWNAYKMPNSSVRRLWEIFDLVGEVVDDLTDVEEDRLAYNGNRFVFYMRQHGTDATIRDYESFIARLCNEFNEIISKHPQRSGSLFFLNEKLGMLVNEIAARLQDCRAVMSGSGR